MLSMDFFYWFFHQWGAESGMAYREWYLALEKPFFAPEPFVFGLAWGIIYPLIALAFAWTLYLLAKRRVPLGFVALFVLNLFLNFSFSPVLLATRDNALISLVIVLVLGTLAWLEFFALRFSKVVFWLLIPYLLWGAFATVLQLSLTALN